MLQTLKKFTRAGLLAAAFALGLSGAVQAAEGAWTQIDTNSSLGTVTYGISMTTTGQTPPLPLTKATSRVDHLVKMGIVSGTATVTTKGVMASDIGKLTATELVGQPSATIAAISPSLSISGTTGGDYRTITNSNGYAGLNYQVTVPASSRVDIYVTEFNSVK